VFIGGDEPELCGLALKHLKLMKIPPIVKLYSTTNHIENYLWIGDVSLEATAQSIADERVCLMTD
jgi:hypothetical protein